MAEEINVCCPFFDVIPCGDTTEHCHIGCRAKGNLINNTLAKSRCIGEGFEQCEHFPSRVSLKAG